VKTPENSPFPTNPERRRSAGTAFSPSRQFAGVFGEIGGYRFVGNFSASIVCAALSDLFVLVANSLPTSDGSRRAIEEPPSSLFLLLAVKSLNLISSDHLINKDLFRKQ